MALDFTLREVILIEWFQCFSAENDVLVSARQDKYYRLYRTNLKGVESPFCD